MTLRSVINERGDGFYHVRQGPSVSVGTMGVDLEETLAERSHREKVGAKERGGHAPYGGNRPHREKCNQSATGPITEKPGEAPGFIFLISNGVDGIRTAGCLLCDNNENGVCLEIEPNLPSGRVMPFKCDQKNTFREAFHKAASLCAKATGEFDAKVGLPMVEDLELLRVKAEQAEKVVRSLREVYERHKAQHGC